MFAAVVLLVFTPAAVATTYTTYPGNAYKSAVIGDFGASALDHCERNSSFEECKHWCDNDCECECFTVYTPNGACFRRHSCDPNKFNNDANFETHVKVNFTSNCTNFEDLGLDTKCDGATLPPLTATNIGSLENCKSLCNMLSFECKGIQYLSNCSNTVMDQCLIYTSQITSGVPLPPAAVDQGSHYHCLKFIGEVRNITGGLIVPLSIGLHGFDGSALAGNQAAANIAGTLIKGVFANMSSHVTAEYVTVEIHPVVPAIADVQIEMLNGTAFYEVVKALQDNEPAIKAQFATLLNQSALDAYKTHDGLFNITDLEFNYSQIEFLTSTSTVTTTPCTEANNCTTTTTTTTVGDQVSHGTQHIPMLSAILVWFVAHFLHA